MTFAQLNIIDPILKTIVREGYSTPTPIQEQAIPVLFEGRDILGSAQTGTGKTAAFAVPIIQCLYEERQQSKAKGQIKALVLAPTRELAAQIRDSFIAYGANLGLKTTVVYGGVSKRNQIVALKRGVDILVATPGRLLDLMNDKYVDLSHVTHFVLDEADRMLDMGFIIDVNKIVAKIPAQRQTMLFSATIPQEIKQLANAILTNPVRVEITPETATLDIIAQSVYLVNKNDKTALLLDLFQDPTVSSVLVFCRTKHGANKLAKHLASRNISVDAIHGNKSQLARQKALKDFKQKSIRVLIATDIAARGIDIDELSHVINYDMPEMPETYIHRIGRTGRAGFNGSAVSFCSEEEMHLLKAVEKHIKMTIMRVETSKYKDNFKFSNLRSSSPRSKPSSDKKPSLFVKKSNDRKTSIPSRKKTHHQDPIDLSQKKHSKPFYDIPFANEGSANKRKNRKTTMSDSAHETAETKYGKQRKKGSFDARSFNKKSTVQHARPRNQKTQNR